MYKLHMKQYSKMNNDLVVLLEKTPLSSTDFILRESFRNYKKIAIKFYNHWSLSSNLFSTYHEIPTELIENGEAFSLFNTYYAWDISDYKHLRENVLFKNEITLSLTVETSGYGGLYFSVYGLNTL